jgi:RimJ/RimL family protein N-acetyltransferase
MLMDDFQGPAYRLETERLRLRCLAPHDTSSVSRAIAESIEHLRPWLTWTAHEPLTLAQRLTWVRTQRGHFDLGSDYCFGAFSKDEAQVLGFGVLRLAADVDERELGYWVHERHLRQGLATELVSALLRVAFEIEQLDAVEIRTFPHNDASARLARKLGFSGPVLDRLNYPMPDGSKSDLHLFGLSRAEYAASPARLLALEAYDALDRRIL